MEPGGLPVAGGVPVGSSVGEMFGVGGSGACDSGSTTTGLETMGVGVTGTDDTEGVEISGNSSLSSPDVITGLERGMFHFMQLMIM